MKKALKYLYIALLLVVPFLMTSVYLVADAYTKRSWWLLPVVVATYFLFFTAGGFLGSSSLMKQIEMQGKWKMNIKKIIVSVILLALSIEKSTGFIAGLIPSSVYSFFAKLNIPLSVYFLSYPASNHDFFFLWTIFSGYFLITSFYKSTINNEK